MPDNFIKIRIGSEADNSGFDSANTKIKDLTGNARELVNTLKLGAGLDIGARLVASIAAVPAILQQAIARGVEFNATMTGAEQGIANVIAKFQGLNAEAAKNEAAKAMAKIAEIEPQSAAGLGDLVQGFMATFAASQSAGISIEQNIELVGAFANALANANIPAEQLSQELRSIFTGNITADSALAKTLSITNQDIARAKEAGNLFGFLKDSIGSLGSAGDTFQVRWSTLQSTIDKFLADVSKPVFDQIFRSLQTLNTELAKPEVANGLKELGHDAAALVASGAELASWAIKHAEGLSAAAHATGLLSVAWAALKFKDLVIGLGLLTAGWVRKTAAINVETAALAANTRAIEANAAAGLARDAQTGRFLPRGAAAGAAGGGGALAMLFGNLNLAAMAGFAGWQTGSWLDRKTGFSEKTSDAMSGVKWGAQNTELRRQMADVEQQIKLADTAEKKLEAEAVLRQVIAELQERAGRASGAEKENLESNLRYFQNIRDHLSAIEGSAVRSASAQKQTADDTARQADEAAALSARAELDYKILQARGQGNQELIRQLEEQKQLEADIATLRKNYVDMTEATAQAIAKEFQQARRAADEMKATLSMRATSASIEKLGKSPEEQSQVDAREGRAEFARVLGKPVADWASSDELQRIAKSDEDKARGAALLEQVEKIKTAEQQIADAKKQASEKDARTAEDEAKKAFETQKRRDLAMDALAEEVEINRAKIAGDDKLVNQLERQRDIRAEINRLLELGVEKSEAEERATEAVNSKYGAQAIAHDKSKPAASAADAADGRIHVRGHRGIGGEYIANLADTGAASPQYTPTDWDSASKPRIAANTPGLDRWKWRGTATEGVSSALPAGVSPATAHDDLKGGGSDKASSAVASAGKDTVSAIDRLAENFTSALQEIAAQANAAAAQAASARQLAQNALLDQGQAT